MVSGAKFSVKTFYQPNLIGCFLLPKATKEIRKGYENTSYIEGSIVQGC